MNIHEYKLEIPLDGMRNVFSLLLCKNTNGILLFMTQFYSSYQNIQHLKFLRHKLVGLLTFLVNMSSSYN